MSAAFYSAAFASGKAKKSSFFLLFHSACIIFVAERIKKDMTKKQEIQLFEERKVRTVWDDEQEKWYFWRNWKS